MASTTAEAVTTTGSGDDGGRRPAARMLAAAAVALVVAGVVGGLTWYVGTERTLARISVDAGLPACTGVQVEQYSDERDPAARFVVPAIPLRAGMQCSVTYRVSNESDSAVRLARFVYPFGGAEGGLAVRVVGIDGILTRASPAGVDAVWTEGADVPAQGVVDLVVEFQFRQDGCTAPGHASIRPTIEVDHLGRSRTIAGPGSPVFRGTPDSNHCGR